MKPHRCASSTPPFSAAVKVICVKEMMSDRQKRVLVVEKKTQFELFESDPRVEKKRRLDDLFSTERLRQPSWL